MTKQIYLAGDMLTLGAQRQRAYEADKLREAGATVYAPQEDKTINDKANAVQEGLAERIVANDTEGIITSDIIVIDAHENGKGTLVELGQVKGMRDVAYMLRMYFELADEGLIDRDELLPSIKEQIDGILATPVYPHNTDIRRANNSLQFGDRREYGVNQYVYGTVLDLTDGHGFYEFDEIVDAIKKEVSE